MSYEQVLSSPLRHKLEPVDGLGNDDDGAIHLLSGDHERRQQAQHVPGARGDDQQPLGVVAAHAHRGIGLSTPGGCQIGYTPGCQIGYYIPAVINLCFDCMSWRLFGPVC
jgi:hypothetical protein